MAEYSDKLKDPRWQKKRLAILERDDWTCQRCSATDAMLVIHHKRYIQDREPWEYPNSLLVTLCQTCHDHVGKDPGSESELLNSDTNFTKVKWIIEKIATTPKRMTSVEYGFIFYLLNQQYGYLKNGKVKDGDYAGYNHIAKCLGVAKTSSMNAVRRLVAQGIIIKTPGNKYGNHYCFNDDYFSHA